MAVTAAQAVVKIEAQGADKVKSDLSDVKKATDETQGGFKGMLSGMVSMAGGLGIFNMVSQAAGFLKDQMGSVLQESMDAADGLAQTETVIKSTGGAAGMTAQQIVDMAGSLSHVTKFSDDTVQSGENLLLTFTGIGKDVFPMATKTMLDMAQAMGGDVKSTAIQMGKALNDPAQGLTALTRVGVTFTDQQKDMIKSMVAAGDTAGAQKIMLQELQREFGGSAEAAGKTFGGQLAILKQRISDVKQSIGDALMPVLTNMMSWVSSTAFPVLEKFGNWFTKDAIPGIQKFGSDAGFVFGYIKTALDRIDLTNFTNAWKAFSGETAYLAGKFNDLMKSLNPLGPLLKQVGSDFDPISHVITTLAQGALGIVTNLLKNAAVNMAEITNAIQNGKGPFAELYTALSNIGNLIKGELGKELKDLGQDAQQIGTWFQSSVVPAIKQALPGFENLGKTILKDVVPAVIKIREVFVDVIQHAFEKFAPIIEKIVPPLIKFAGILANDVANGLKFIMPYVTQAAQAIGKFADEIIDRVAPIVTKWINDMMPLVKAFSDWWNKNWPAMSQILKGVWDIIVGVIKIAWAIVTGIIKIGLDILGGNWKQAWNDMKDMLGGIWDGIKNILSGAWEIIKGLFTGWITDATNAGSNIVNGIANGIRAAIGAVGNAISSVASFITDHLPKSPAKIGPLKDLAKQGANISNQISEGMLSSMPKLTASMNMMLSPVSNVGGTQFPSMQKGSMASSNQLQTVYLQIDKQTFARLILPAFTDQVRNNVGMWNQ